MKNKHKFSLLFTIVAFLTLFLTGCSNNSSSTAKKSSNNQITVNYTLKQGKKTVSDKSVKIPKKKAKVITGLKKAWKVQETKGFITSIDGKKQNLRKRFIGLTQLTANGQPKVPTNKLLLTRIKLNLL